MTLQKRHITIKDVAEQAGVALSTASYVLNNKKRSISAATQQRVLSAAREMGYQPNLAARSLVTQRTHIVSLWISDVASPFSALIVSQIQRTVRQHGYDLIISEILPPNDPAHDGGRNARWRVDGVIAFLGPECRELDLPALFPDGTPLVSIGALAVPDTDFIEIDLFPGTQAAVHHLAASGRRRVAFLVPENRIFPGDYRYEAYRTTVQEAGQEAELILIPDNSRADALRGVQNYVRAHGAPDGIFCYNDGVAIGAYRGLRDLGLRVPGDVTLVGCDGIEDTKYLDCPLSTIVLPTEEMCRVAWQFLERRMETPTTPPQKTTLCPKLEVRDSSDGKDKG